MSGATTRSAWRSGYGKPGSGVAIMERRLDILHRLEYLQSKSKRKREGIVMSVKPQWNLVLPVGTPTKKEITTREATDLFYELIMQLKQKGYAVINPEVQEVKNEGNSTSGR